MPQSNDPERAAERAQELAEACYRAQHTQEQERARCTPDRIFEIARNDVAVNFLLQAWRRGDYSWEEMLIEMVACLSERNQRFVASAVKQMQAAPPIPVPK